MLDTEFDFTRAIIGVDYFGQPIYSFDAMVRSLILNEYFSREEAEEYLRSRLESEETNDNFTVLYRYY